MAKKRFIRAVIGFMSLCVFVAIINVVDYALIYAIFIYLQTLAVPFMVAVDYFFYVFRLSMPYIFMYILISIFFNLQLYKRNATIRIFRYTVDINTVKKSKIYIYARQYNYILIIALNLFLLFIVYYSYINHKYFYLLFVFLFYALIWIVIKIKHFLFKNEKLQYKKVHMLVNLILVALVGTYISLALEDLNISNVKLYGFENFWKLIDNKYFIKMPSKDFNWNRVFNWSKHTSTDRYMFDLKKGLMKTEFLDKPQEINIDSKLDLASNIAFKEKALLSYQDLQNNDININQNVNIADYLYKMQNDDYNMGKFTNAIYQKFKKVFLIQLQMKSTNFMPTPEMNERQKLFNWLHNPSNFIDLSKFYMSTESTDSTEYNDYLNLIDKKYNNFTSKKVFLITLHKNYFNLKSFVFYADFENSFKKNYAIFLNSEKFNIDLKNNSILNFEYYNSDLYLNFDFNDLWQNFQKELYIIFKDNKIVLSLFIKKFKTLYHIKSFKFSFKEDVLTESDSDLMLEIKPKKSLGIPDFKKLQVWKTFKLNYKEIIYNYTKELRAHKNFKLENKWLEEDKWLKDNKLIIPKEPFNEIFFWVEDDIVYSLTDYIKLKQVDDLIFNTPSQEYDEVLSEHVSYYLENIKSSAKALNFKSTKKFTTILINDVDKIIAEYQHTRVHVPKFSSMYHEIIYQNSNEAFKYILENFEFSRDLLTSSRSLMTFDMWNALMHKLLNLNMNSMYLKNMADFNDFCKSDFTDDLEFNFSLAFNIMQNKNDLMKFQIIPDLEGIPGTSYEYTVKYNQHMDRYYWYEEQEAIIDWFYEISYYSLVNIMDTVKVVDGKENDFLYDMINMYLREPKYKWVAELFESRGMEENSKQLINLNKKLNLLNDIEYWQKKKELIILKDKINYNLINKTNIINFDDINNLQQLNYKLGKDLSVIKTLFDVLMKEVDTVYPEMIDDLTTLHHVDIHTNEFELMLQYYTEARDAQNYEQGELGNVGLQLNHNIKKLCPGISFEAIDTYVEIKNLERLEFFLEEMDSVMMAEFNDLLETEEFDYTMEDVETTLIKKYNYFLITYKEALLKAKFDIFNKMISNVDEKAALTANNDEVVCRTNNFTVEYEKLKCIELKKAQLAKLPIFDWYTYTYIDKNIDILMKEDMDLLLYKMDLLEKQAELEELKLKEMKKVNKLYGKKIIRNYIKNPKNPLTKQYIDKNWDDYNYLSNKSDKLMKDWYKVGKKK